ncbi:MAG: hypothetical protein ACO2PM_20920 [Pyrobaculum sp.]
MNLLDAVAYAEELFSRFLVGLPADAVAMNFVPALLLRKAVAGRLLVVDEALCAVPWADTLGEKLCLSERKRVKSLI